MAKRIISSINRFKRFGKSDGSFNVIIFLSIICDLIIKLLLNFKTYMQNTIKFQLRRKERENAHSRFREIRMTSLKFNR